MKMSRITWSDNIGRIKINSRIYMKLKSKGLTTKLKRRSIKFRRAITGLRGLAKRERLKSPGSSMKTAL
jgi:uncharacterized protein YfeS